ncbi:MAG TPA: chromosome segregation protein SMC [Candidatus Hypogeohydataceae bacterium YC40]
MQLAKLELIGFKSFADKTEFAVAPGITIIVGPNGCGKSNIVDAVKWVLGEQGTKSLRATEMTDVIFGGNNHRPASGYAEAAVTLVNDKGLLPLEYQEVCITRRLYSSGESEYLINKQLRRLKDIKELLMDTGLGTDCYSLIEQGEVDMLLQANSQERRVVFEEAAGISKYRARKKAALSKLEKIEQNLLRLGDIVEEVQKQSRSVKLQAAKARKYKEYTERLKELRIQWALKCLHEFQAQRSNISSQIEQTLCQERALKEEKEALESQKKTLEETLQQLSTQLSRERTELAYLEGQISKTTDKITMEEQRIQELKLQASKASEHLQSLQARKEELESQLLMTQQEVVTVADEIEKFSSLLSQQEKEYRLLAQECHRCAEEIENKKSLQIDTLQHQTKLQNELNNVSHEKDSLLKRKVRLEEQVANADKELQTLQNEKLVLEEERDLLARKKEELENAFQALNQRKETLRGEETSLEENLSQKKQYLSARKARQDMLKDFEARAEGVEGGTRAILEKALREGLSGIKGIVADVIKVELPHALALEAALGTKSQALLAQTIQDALQALSLLETNQKGRATFIPMDYPTNGNNGLPVVSEEGVFKALDLIRCNESYLPLLKKLLERTLVVKDLPAALSLARRYPEARFVTLKGEILEPEGSLTGGSPPKADQGLISRRSELESLEKETKSITEGIESVEMVKKERQQEYKNLEPLLIDNKNQLEEVQKSYLAKERGLQEKGLKLNLLMEEKETTSKELDEIQSLQEELCLQEGQLRNEFAEVEKKIQEVKEAVELASKALYERQSRKEAIEKDLTGLKVTLAAKEEKGRSLSAEVMRLQESREELSREIALNLQSEREAEDKQLAAQQEVSTLKQLFKELEDKKGGLSSRITLLEEKEGQHHQALSQLTPALEEKERQRLSLQEGLQSFRLKEKEYEIKMSDLEEKIIEEYQVELRGLTPQEIDWSQATQEMEELKSKIERLGNVNLEALQELDELEIRENFLTTQKEDLLKAKNSLAEIIRKINQTSKELFEKSFNEIRENFNVMFRKLFGGGRAHIFLEEGADSLEAGIEIVAQPPGKELRSISLLSGGERSMTAVALLFAIFLSKPSPFCILNEVDAALDESNVGRFTQVLKEFTQNTQFVVITHNKRTMAVGDTLYGITMEEPGISKKVAVKLEEIEETTQGSGRNMSRIEEPLQDATRTREKPLPEAVSSE